MLFYLKFTGVAIATFCFINWIVSSIEKFPRSQKIDSIIYNEQRQYQDTELYLPSFQDHESHTQNNSFNTSSLQERQKVKIILVTCMTRCLLEDEIENILKDIAVGISNEVQVKLAVSSSVWQQFSVKYQQYLMLIDDLDEPAQILQHIWKDVFIQETNNNYGWVYILDAAHNSVTQANRNILKLKVIFNRFRSDIPLVLGNQQYNSNIPVNRGLLLPPIEKQNWLPFCSTNASLYSMGFISMFGRNGGVNTSCTPSKGNPCGLSRLEECILSKSIQTEESEWTRLGVCLYEQFGLGCQNLALALESAESNQHGKPETEWSLSFRHQQWNCSLETLDSKESKTGLVSAMCQDTLWKHQKVDEVGGFPGLSGAPDIVSGMYEVVDQPSDKQHKQLNPHREGRKTAAKSWVTLNSDFTEEKWDREPVVYDSGEIRDAVFVVGAGASVNIKPVELFVRSLRSTGCRAEIVLFMDARCIETMYRLGNEYGGILFVKFNATSLEKQFRSGKPVVIYRFALYEHFLRVKRTQHYRYCMHADLFDTYFQRDPFQNVNLREGLAFFAENHEVEMAFCRYHRMWFAQCKEWTLLHRVHAMPRTCMGFVMGTVSSFLSFLRLTLYRMLQHCNDQGVLNILITSGQYALATPVTVYSPNSGAVLHVNTDWSFQYDNDWKVLSSDGKPYSVIHQWDRIFKINGQSRFMLKPIRSDLEKRRAYQKNFWFENPKHKWEKNGMAFPECVTVNSGKIYCRTGLTSSHGSSNSIFCPTHTKLLPVSFKRVQAQRIHYDTNESKVLRALNSETLRCISDKVLNSKCVNKFWCEVKTPTVLKAAQTCETQVKSDYTPNQSDASTTFRANIVFECQVHSSLFRLCFCNLCFKVIRFLEQSLDGFNNDSSRSLNISLTISESHVIKPLKNLL
eukprot:m.215183 g.215183  ORF g.215183 m.215183 type:complete len:911 (-) comp15876_c0_seq6:545-3277(-)